MVQGYFNYHAVPDNIRAMNVFRGLVGRFRLRALRRRSQKGKYLNRESHHGGSATRKLMKIATLRFVAGLTGVIPAFREGILEVECRD